VQMTTVSAALAEHPDLIIHLSGYKSWQFAIRRMLTPRFLESKGFLPPFFHTTMAQKIDPRQPKLAQGLGLFDGRKGKFYPSAGIAKGESIEDEWMGRRLQVERRASDGVLHATWADTGEEPMQLLTRWYGFSFTFPGCDLWEDERKG